MDETKTKKRTRKHAFSAVDAVLILLLVAAVAGVVLRVVTTQKQADATEGAPTMYAVYFEVEETHEDVLASVASFDAVYLLDGDARLGYMGAYRDRDTGEFHIALTPAPAEGAEGDRRVTALGCFVATEAENTAGGLLVGKSGLYLAPGACLEVRTDRARMTIRITEILPHS